MKKSNCILALILMTFLGCGGSGGDSESGSNKDPKVISDEKISFEILKSGGHEVGENFGESIKVVKTQAEFEKVFALTNSVVQKEIPDVDFTKNNVLALFYGGKISGSFKIKLKEIRLENGALTAYISKSGPCDIETTDITSPYVYATYSKSVENLVFKQSYSEESRLNNACPDTSHISKNVNFTNLIYVEADSATPENSQHFEVIRNQKRYDAVFKESNIRLEKPNIDFANEVVIYLAMGYFPTGGYHIELSKITKKANHVIADITTTYPGNHCQVTDQVTAPKLFVKIPKTDSYGSGGIVFNETRVQENCK